MTLDTAKQIISAVSKKHPKFRHIEMTLTDRGFNVTFADIPDMDMRTISNWFYNAGGTPLYVGREFRFDGYVMVAEVKAA